MAREEIKIRLSSQGAQKVKGELRGVERTMNGLAGSVKGFVGAFVGIAIFAKVVSGLKNVITGTIKARDEIAKFSKATGTSVEFLSAIGFAAERSGASLQAVQIGMRRLIRSMQDAKDGLAEGVRKFEQLGISALDASGSMRNSEDVFIDIADRIAAMTNETEKAAIAQEIFGKSGLALVPLLEEGSVGIEKLMEKARELGIVFDQEAAVAAEKAADAMTDFDTATTAMGQNITTVAIPAITNLFNVLSGVVTGEAKKELGEFTKAAGIKEWTAAIVQGIDPANKWALGVLAMTKAKEGFGFVGPMPQVVTDEGLDNAEELTEHQIAIQNAQQRILEAQEKSVIQQQALLGLKQQGLVAWSEEELLQQRILAGSKQQFESEELIVERKVVEISQDKTLNAAKDAANLKTKTAIVLNKTNFSTLEQQVQASRRFIMNLTNGLELFKGMDRFARSLLRNVEGIASQLATQAFTAFLLSFLPGSGGFLNTFKGLLGIGGRDEGGPVRANEPVIVGENRRELFIPDTAGTIIPEVPSGDFIVNLFGPFYGDIDQFAEELAARSDQNFNRIKVNA